MGRKIVAVLVGLALALGITVVAATPALASFSQCPAGIGCVWIDANGGGTRWDLPISVYHANVCHNMSEQGSAWVNSVSSAETGYGSNYGIAWFTQTNCSFGSSLFQPHLTTVNFSTVGTPPFNDNIESFVIETV